MKRKFSVLFPVLLGLCLLLVQEPAGLQKQGWQLLAIFMATISAIVLRPAPMGMVALVGLGSSVAFKILTFSEAFTGFSSDVVWLVVFAFFIARGFIITKLGLRISYKIMSLLGKNSLGLGYALAATDLALAPVVPSFTARAGGIVYPIMKSLAEIFTGASHDPKMGGFLSMTAFQSAVISSSMFLTAMAANPLIMELARGQGVEISWGLWALCALVPGLISLGDLPYFLYRYAPPTIRQTPHAKEMALRRLKEMGKMKREEWILIAVFVLLLILWVFGPWIGVNAATAALIGISILLLAGVLQWRDVLEETGAWDTFIWFSVLITLSGYLNKLGVSAWFSDYVVEWFGGSGWMGGLFFISLIYFYTHYFFASSTAHVGAMYAPLLIVAIGMGAPPMLAALLLGFFSSLFGGLTHYSSGPAPIFFGAGYVSVSTWWKMGFLVSILNIGIWIVFGGLWWKLIGIW